MLNDPNQKYHDNLAYNLPNNIKNKQYTEQQQQQSQQQQQQRRFSKQQQEILQGNITGYGSDGSEGTLSVNSAQSMQNRLNNYLYLN